MNTDKPQTTDQLRIAIDRGAQGDKVDFPDPAAAPLGTDEEAAGNPPEGEEIAKEPVGTRHINASPWIGAAAYVGVAAVILAVFVFIAFSASG